MNNCDTCALSESEPRKESLCYRRLERWEESNNTDFDCFVPKGTLAVDDEQIFSQPAPFSLKINEAL